MTDPAPRTAAVVAYEQAALDRYLAASAEARAQVACELVEAQQRLARARAAVEAQRLLNDLAVAAVADVTRSRRRLDAVAALLGTPAEPVR